MINRVLLNVVYLFYPKKVCFYEQNETYLQCEEYKKLQETIELFDSEKNLIWRKTLTNKFDQDITLKNYQDLSRLDLQDRCLIFHFNIIENGELWSITLYISFLIPYYVIKCRKHEVELLFSPSKILEVEKENFETRKIEDLILTIEIMIENELLYNKLPKELINLLVEDISFGDVRLGHFTMFNAFFNNDYIYEDEKNN